MSERDPYEEHMAEILRKMAANLDRLMLKRSDQAPEYGQIEIDGKRIPYLGEIKAIWTGDDEPMTEMMDTFVRGYPRRIVNHQEEPADCDCPKCEAAREEERRMWAEVGIDVFRKENT